jgi:hypothetical protein
MASKDSSFNASGPTVVAFETIDTGPRSFGVGVEGNQVGVHGEGMASPQGSRAVSVLAVGVHGRGDHYGVYGVAGTIKSEDAPELILASPQGAIGVIGVSAGGAAPAPAVLGDNGVLKPAMSADPNLSDDMSNIIAVAPVGVAGVSAGATGGGVVGVAGIDTPNGRQALEYLGGPPTRAERNGILGFNSGVSAIGAGPGPGLYALTSGGRAGIFESLRSQQGVVAAQVQLVPFPVNVLPPGAGFTPVETPLVSLPRLAQLGDLISVVIAPQNQRSAASLWFCIHSGTDTQNPAQWAEISFGRAVIGNA